MENKYWTIRYKTMEGGHGWAKCISMSVTKAVEWVCRKYGISPEQIDYMSGEEAEQI